MSINLIDIIAVALILLIALLSAKKGLFKVLINFAAYVIAVIAARFAASPLSDIIYNNFVQIKILDYLNNILPDSETVTLKLRDILPESILKIVEFFKLASVDDFVEGLNSAIAPENIETTFIKPLVLKILLIVVTVILFFVLSLILGFIAKWLNKVLFKKKNGIISKFNKVLGFIFGLLKGSIPVLIICEVLNLIASVSTSELLINTVGNSYICSFISGLIK